MDCISRYDLRFQRPQRFYWRTFGANKLFQHEQKDIVAFLYTSIKYAEKEIRTATQIMLV